MLRALVLGTSGLVMPAQLFYRCSLDCLEASHVIVDLPVTVQRLQYPSQGGSCSGGCGLIRESIEYPTALLPGLDQPGPMQYGHVL